MKQAQITVCYLRFNSTKSRFIELCSGSPLPLLLWKGRSWTLWLWHHRRYWSGSYRNLRYTSERLPLWSSSCFLRSERLSVPAGICRSWDTSLKILYRSDIVIGIHLRYVLYKESSLLQEPADFADFYVSLHRYYISLRQIGDKLGETGVFCLLKCTKFPVFSFKKPYKSLQIPSFWPSDSCIAGIYSPRCFIVGTV